MGLLRIKCIEENDNKFSELQMMTFCKALEVTKVDKPLKYFQLETIQLVLGCISEVRVLGASLSLLCTPLCWRCAGKVLMFQLPFIASGGHRWELCVYLVLTTRLYVNNDSFSSILRLVSVC